MAFQQPSISRISVFAGLNLNESALWWKLRAKLHVKFNEVNDPQLRDHIRWGDRAQDPAPTHTIFRVRF